MDYFDMYYPKGVMYRFFFGAGGTRCLHVSRPLQHDPKGLHCHFSAMTLATPADLVRLFICWHTKKDDGVTLKDITRNFVREPWTAMHIGWIVADSTSLSHDNHLTLDTTSFEIVFDFDLPKWDVKATPLRARTGFLCSCALHPEAKSCRGCWLLIRLARRVLDYCFQNSPCGRPLWVFSGGKGAHCYYGSQRARVLPLTQRDSLVKLLENLSTSNTIVPATLGAAWEQIVVREAGVMAADKQCHLLATAYLPTETAKRFMGALVRCPEDSSMRWALFAQHAGPAITRRVICDLALPVVDAGPLTKMKGDIKAPFSIHQSTQRFALPLSDAEFAVFDPATSLSLATLTPETAPRLKIAATYLNEWLSDNGYVV